MNFYKRHVAMLQCNALLSQGRWRDLPSLFCLIGLSKPEVTAVIVGVTSQHVPEETKTTFEEWCAMCAAILPVTPRASRPTSQTMKDENLIIGDPFGEIKWEPGLLLSSASGGGKTEMVLFEITHGPCIRFPVFNEEEPAGKRPAKAKAYRRS